MFRLATFNYLMLRCVNSSTAACSQAHCWGVSRAVSWHLSQLHIVSEANPCHPCTYEPLKRQHRFLLAPETTNRQSGTFLPTARCAKVTHLRPHMTEYSLRCFIAGPDSSHVCLYSGLY